MTNCHFKVVIIATCTILFVDWLLCILKVGNLQKLLGNIDFISILFVKMKLKSHLLCDFLKKSV